MLDLLGRTIVWVTRTSRRLLISFVIFCALIFVIHQLVGGPSPHGEIREEKEEERHITTEGVISQGKPLVLAMEGSGIERSVAYQICDVLGKVVDLRKCRPGEEFLLKESERGEFVEFQYKKDEKNTYKVVKAGEELVGLKLVPNVEKRIVRVNGRVSENLYDALLILGETPVLVANFVEMFSWEIDFAADVRKGDEMEMLIEKEYIGGDFVGYGRILVGRYKGYFGEKWSFLFKNGSTEDYYDPEGASLRRAIMRAPLSYRRISSKFSLRRRHPILKIYRPHYGVDYAAPSGTQVMAAGDGVVKSAGWKGAYGRYVRIRHPNGYETGYGHLRAIAKGVRVGARVKAKQVIGWVGSSGLSTGPHLQYEVLKNGKYINPLTMKLPPVKSVERSLLPEFKKHVERAKTALQEWGSPAVAEKQQSIFESLARD